MSASREKKQRQQISDEVKLTQAQEEQANAARRKRNKIIYGIIGAVVVILAAALLIWDSGVFQRNATVATIDGEDITASQLAYYYYDHSIIQTAQLYAQYGISDFPFSATTSPQEQTIDSDDAEELGIDESYVGKTYHDLFMDYAVSSLREERILLKAAKEAGYTLSEDGKQAVEAELASLDSVLENYLTYYGVDLSRTAYLQSVYGDSMSFGKYRESVEDMVLSNEFFNLHIKTLADYSEDDLRAYYEENKLDLNSFSYYVRFFSGTAETKKDDDGNTIQPTDEEEKAAMDAAKKAAEDAQAALGSDVDALADNEDYTHEDGLLSIASDYYDWLTDSARKNGDSKVFEQTSGYYLVVFDKAYLDERNTVDLRHILISAMAEDDPATTDVNEAKADPTEEAYETAKQTAENLLNEFKSNNGTPEDFGNLAVMYSADGGSNTKGGVYENVREGQMIDSFNDWIFDEARQSGDTGLVKNTESATKGWHIIYYVGQDEPVWMSNARVGKWSEELKNTVEVTLSDKLDSFFK